MSVEAIAVVLNHSKATGTAKLVLIGIANHINPDNDGAWPSQERLASYANISDRSVRYAIEQLVALGELRYETAQGNSQNQYKPNRYWLMLSCPADCDGTVNHRRVEVYGNRVEECGNQGGSLLSSGWKPASDEPVYNHKETVNKPIIPQKDFEASKTWKMFIDWYQCYPRKEGKQYAYRQFVKALKIASYDELMAGVIRFRNDPNLPVLKSKIKHPATWLSKGCWDDEPLPVPFYNSEELATIRAMKNKQVVESDKRITEAFIKEQQEKASRVASEAAPERCKHDRIMAVCPKCFRNLQ